MIKKNIASKELIKKLMEWGEQARLAKSISARASRVSLWASKKAGVPKRYHEKIKALYGFDAVEVESGIESA